MGRGNSNVGSGATKSMPDSHHFSQDDDDLEAMMGAVGGIRIDSQTGEVASDVPANSALNLLGAVGGTKTESERGNPVYPTILGMVVSSNFKFELKSAIYANFSSN